MKSSRVDELLKADFRDVQVKKLRNILTYVYVGERRTTPCAPWLVR